MTITEIQTLPKDFHSFAIRAADEGHKFLLKMNEEWIAGKNRFSREGEVLFSVTLPSGALIGIGGLNVDPYTDSPQIGRVRHVYVLAPHRGSGIGKALVSKVIESARHRFSVLRLRTHNQDAVQFYKSLGFIVDSSVNDPAHTSMLAILR